MIAFMENNRFVYIPLGLLHSITSAMSDRMGQSFKNAEKLIRTEASHFHNEAEKAAYKAAGVKEYEFMATLEVRTCSVCGDLDGKHFPVDKAQTGVNFPPMHPSCRCTTIEYDPDDEMDWYNSGEEMPRNMTYQEWYDYQTAAYGEGYVEIERKKVYNKKADTEQYDSYRTILPSEEIPETLEAFQNMKYKNVEKYSYMAAKTHLYNSVSKREILPNAGAASTPSEKIQDYLLNSNHPRGKDKAHVINKVLGYHYQNWNEFSDKLFREVQKSPATKGITTRYGTKYTVPVIMYGKKDRYLHLNTVWQIDSESDIPRLITATFYKKNK
ncbi:MAG: minor capsid protein [Oscillospiraceae bacterium]|nr:minor capsid protein [Oscillospiraceae bacterium]